MGVGRNFLTAWGGVGVGEPMHRSAKFQTPPKAVYLL